ncbi:MAG TPA: hypothetical protein VF175_06445 [Lacipirellula sp.]
MNRLQSRRWTRIAITLAAVVIAVALADAASACPTCKDSVAQNDPQLQRMAAGYYYSILFMLSMPFLIVSTLGTCAYRLFKKAESDRAAVSGKVAAG